MKSYSGNSEFIELRLNTKGCHVRISLGEGAMTTTFKDWFSWHVDTEQRQLAHNIIHFVEPNGEVVGIKTYPTDSVPFRGGDHA